MDSAAAPAHVPAHGIFEDGLGKRRQIADPSGADTLELLCLRDELTTVPAFEFALRERTGRLASFRHVSFAHVRSVDRLSDPAATLAVMSEHTHGVRLSKIFAAGDQRALDITASIHLIRQLVSATALLHEHARDAAHGAIGPERLVITPTARLVVVEYVLGSALEQLHYSHERYWNDLRIALPRSAGLPRFDQRADVLQIGVVALSLILGRTLRDDEFPSRLPEVLASAWAISARGGFEPLPHGIRAWLGRALLLESRSAFANAIEAQYELDRVLADDGEYEDEEDGFLPESGASNTESAAGVSKPIVLISESDEAYEPLESVEPVHLEPVGRVEHVARVEPIARVEPVAAAASYVEPVQSVERLTPLEPVKPYEPAKTVEPVKPVDSGKAVESINPVEPVKPARAFVFEPVKPVEHAEFRAPWLTDERRESDEASEQHEGLLESPMSMHTRRKPVGLIAAVAAAVIGIAIAGTFGAKRYFAPSALAAMTGTLSVTSNPAGAQVIIDGQTRGVTPISIALNPGPHMLELHGSGDPRSIPVTITAGSQASQYIELPKATSATGLLQIRTEPAGAMVTVDDVPRGPSPVTVDNLAAGEHNVHVTSDVGSVKQKVMVEAGATSSVVVPLVAAEGAPVSGWIAISAPAEVQIFENKRLLGTSQSDRIMVSAGRHELDIVNETLGYRTSKTVQVPPGKVAQVKADWPKGTIALNAIPWADVWIDGEKVGETPIGNLSVPIGSHEVVFRNPELGEQRHAVSVTATTPARLSVDMRKK